MAKSSEAAALVDTRVIYCDDNRGTSVEPDCRDSQTDPFFRAFGVWKKCAISSDENIQEALAIEVAFLSIFTF